MNKSASQDRRPFSLEALLRSRRVRFLITAFIICTVLLSSGFGLRKVLTSRGDFTGFYDRGGAVLEGENIYQKKDVRRYLPVFAILNAPFAYLPIGFAWFIWTGLSIACLYIAVKQCTALSRAGPVTLANPVVALPLCLTSIFWSQNLFLGGTNLFVLALLTSAIYHSERGRPVRAGASLGLATALKLFPALLFLYWLIKRDFKQLIAGGATLLVLGIGLPVLVYGPAKTIEYHREWLSTSLLPIVGNRPGRFEHSLRYKNQSLQASLGRLLVKNNAGSHSRPFHVNVANLTPEKVGLITNLLAVLFIAGLLWVVRNGKRAGHWKRRADYGLFLICMLALSPVSWITNFLLFLPPLAFLTAAAAQDPARYSRLAVTAAAAVFAGSILVLNPYTGAYSPLVLCCALVVFPLVRLQRIRKPSSKNGAAYERSRLSESAQRTVSGIPSS